MLGETGGDKERAAQILGIDLSTLYRWQRARKDWDPFFPDAAALRALDERISASTPLGRMAEADDIARAVLFLVSDDSTHLTATEIVIDGGATGAPAHAFGT